MKDLEFLQNFSKELCKKLGIEAEIEIVESPDSILVSLNGENLGHIIGFRGEILHSFERLFDYIFRKQTESTKRIFFDVGEYKKRREEKLIFIAQKVANEVLNTSVAHKFSPMLPSERRVIHTEISKFPNLISYSVGEGAERRLIVERNES